MIPPVPWTEIEIKNPLTSLQCIHQMARYLQSWPLVAGRIKSRAHCRRKASFSSFYNPGEDEGSKSVIGGSQFLSVS